MLSQKQRSLNPKSSEIVSFYILDVICVGRAICHSVAALFLSKQVFGRELKWLLKRGSPEKNGAPTPIFVRVATPIVAHLAIHHITSHHTVLEIYLHSLFSLDYAYNYTKY